MIKILQRSAATQTVLDGLISYPFHSVFIAIIVKKSADIFENKVTSEKKIKWVRLRHSSVEDKQGHTSAV